MEVKLTVSNSNMLLCVYDLRDFSRLFNLPKDGLAVELTSVSEDFNCNEPLEIEPNRTNGFSKLSGQLFEPIYRNEIEKQVAALLEKNSKKPRSSEKTCNYIDLGTTPHQYQNVPLEGDLFYIRDKKLCTKIHTYGFCGALIDYRPYKLTYRLDRPYVPYKPKVPYTWIEFRIQFKKNQVDPLSGELNKVKDYLKKKEIEVLQVEIDAFASVEGTSEANDALFSQRAQNIIEGLTELNANNIPLKLRTEENWQMMRDQLNGSADFAHWKGLAREKLKDKLSDLDTANRFEGYLQHQRYADIRIKVKPKQTRYWNTYRAYYESKEIIESFDDSKEDRLLELGRYLVHNFAQANYRVQDQFLKLEYPKSLVFEKLRYQQYMLPFFIGTRDGVTEMVEKLKEFSKKIDDPEVEYNLKVAIANHPGETKEKDLISLSKSLLKELELAGASESEILDIELWYHFQMASLVFRSQDSRGINKADPSIEFIHEHYLTHQPQEDFILDLARFYLAFDHQDWAKELLEPLVERENPRKDALILYLIHCLKEEQQGFASRYAARLMDAHEYLGPSLWCGMFVGDCKIPISVLHQPTIRSLYCGSCQNLIYSPDARSNK